jgi:hypothetical protein
MDMDIGADEAAAKQARAAAKLGERPEVAERRGSHAAASTPGGSSRVERLTSLCLEAVRSTVGEMFKRIPTGQCANCGAMAPVMKRCRACLMMPSPVTGLLPFPEYWFIISPQGAMFSNH